MQIRLRSRSTKKHPRKPWIALDPAAATWVSHDDWAADLWDGDTVAHGIVGYTEDSFGCDMSAVLVAGRCVGCDSGKNFAELDSVKKAGAFCLSIRIYYDMTRTRCHVLLSLLPWPKANSLMAFWCSFYRFFSGVYIVYQKNRFHHWVFIRSSTKIDMASYTSCLVFS